MKKTLLLLIIVFCGSILNAQNLVPNPSFEQHDTCPSDQGQIKYATGWNSYGYSPDYFNSCNSDDWGAPLNAAGYQVPATGNAYAGFVTYVNWGETREYIGAQLLSPLITGVKYFVSFKACLSDNPSIVYASNKLGALFSTISYSVDSFCPSPCGTTSLPPKNFAHFYTDNIITDTANWTSISGSFIADSAYQYIIIGNHFDSAHTSVLLLDSNTSGVVASYLIDDIYVGIDSTVNTEIHELVKTIRTYPNPTSNLVNVYIPDNNNSATIGIYNLFGEAIYEEKTSSDINVIHLNKQPAGIYIIKVQIEYHITIKKLVLTNKN